jgi:valyl-tRNA synthetase
VLVEVLDEALRLLHPIMPFVTEEIWQRLPHEGESLMIAAFPQGAGARDAEAEASMGRLMEVVTEIRTIRATYEVEPKRRIEVTLVAPSAADREFVGRYRDLIGALARLAKFELLAAAPEQTQTIKHPVGPMELRIPMAGLFDVAAEKTRLTKERLKVDQELEGLRKKLDNPQFVARAKAEVVTESRERVASLTERREKVERTLKDLGALA